MALARLPGDWDGDGDVDDEDYRRFAGCVTGPAGGALGPGCTTFDLTDDLAIDLVDYAVFQTLFDP